MYQITGHTRFGGLLGSPVAHSLSPAMHNYSFMTLGIDAVYLAFEVGTGKIGETVRVFRDLNAYGFNLTMPVKKKVMEYLDHVTEAADLIGAVNTVVNENGALTGYNTDGIGFVRSVREHGYEPEGKEVTVFGAGGAASALSVQLALDGVKKLHLVSRRSASFEAARDLADRISSRTGCSADLTDLADEAGVGRCLGDSSLVVNATSVGMAPKEDASVLHDPSLLHLGLCVADVIYHPRKTKLMMQAEEAGCSIIGGLDMLLFQGAEAFRLWTGQQMPVEQVKERFFKL